MLIDPVDPEEFDDPEAISTEDADETDSPDADEEAEELAGLEALRVELDELPPKERTEKLLKQTPEDQEVLAGTFGITPLISVGEDDSIPIVSPSSPRYAEAIRSANYDIETGLQWAKESQALAPETRGRISKPRNFDGGRLPAPRGTRRRA